MNKSELISSIRFFCSSNASEELAKKYNYYFKEKQDFYGLSSPTMTAFTKTFHKKHILSLPTLLEAAPELLTSNKYEETSLLILILKGLAKQYTPDLLTELDQWYKIGIRNWAHADAMAMFILHEFHARKIIDFTSLETWLSSPFSFQRRSVPVSMVKWGKKQKNISELLDFNEPLMSDNVREVHQGIGWFLRDCWKVQPQVTEDFLLKYKDSSARLIFQYACEKMTAENKEKFKRHKN